VASHASAPTPVYQSEELVEAASRVILVDTLKERNKSTWPGQIIARKQDWSQGAYEGGNSTGKHDSARKIKVEAEIIALPNILPDIVLTGDLYSAASAATRDRTDTETTTQQLIDEP
jgi:hypothetical protein